MGSVPTGVKIISVLYYIAAVLLAIAGALFIFGLEKIGAGGFFGPPGSSGYIGVGVFLLILAILGIVIGSQLWRGRNWARIIVIVLHSLGFLLALFALLRINIGSIVSLIFSGIIVYYLMFNKEVKAAFS